jgi:hypothetical protein
MHQGSPHSPCNERPRIRHLLPHSLLRIILRYPSHARTRRHWPGVLRFTHGLAGSQDVDLRYQSVQKAGVPHRVQNGFAVMLARPGGDNWTGDLKDHDMGCGRFFTAVQTLARTSRPPRRTMPTTICALQADNRIWQTEARQGAGAERDAIGAMQS